MRGWRPSKKTRSKRHLTRRRKTIAKIKTLALSVESDEIRYLATDGRRVREWGATPLSDDIVQDGQVLDAVELGAAISSLLEEKRLKASHVVFEISGLRTLPRLLRLPQVDKKILEESILNEAERQLPLPIGELYTPRTKISDEGAEIRYLTVAISKNQVDLQVDALEAARLKSFVIDVKPLALARAVNRENAIICEIELDRAELAIVVDGVLKLARILHFKGHELSVSDKASYVASELTRTLAHYANRQPDGPIGPDVPLFLVGKLARDPEVKALIADEIDNPLEELDLELQHPDDFPALQFTACVGLAMKHNVKAGKKGSKTSQTFDLDIIPDRFAPGKSKKMPLLTLLAGVFLGALLTLTYQVEVDGAARISDQNFRLINLNEQLIDAEDTTAVINSLEKSVENLTAESSKLLGDGMSFVDGLDAVFSQVPYGVSLSSVSISGDSIDVDGTAQTRTTAIHYVGLIEQGGDFAAVNVTSLATLVIKDSEPLMQFTIVVDR